MVWDTRLEFEPSRIMRFSVSEAFSSEANRRLLLMTEGGRTLCQAENAVKHFAESGVTYRAIPRLRSKYTVAELIQNRDRFYNG